MSDAVTASVLLDGFVGAILGGGVTAAAVWATIRHERNLGRRQQLVLAATAANTALHREELAALEAQEHAREYRVAHIEQLSAVGVLEALAIAGREHDLVTMLRAWHANCHAAEAWAGRPRNEAERLHRARDIALGMWIIEKWLSGKAFFNLRRNWRSRLRGRRRLTPDLADGVIEAQRGTLDLFAPDGLM